MKITNKLTIKLFLIISLFASAAIAEDGNMPGGTFTNSLPETPCVTVTADDGNMPGGTIICQESDDDGNMPGGTRISSAENSTKEDSILKFIRNYIFSIFG